MNTKSRNRSPHLLTHFWRLSLPVTKEMKWMNHQRPFARGPLLPKWKACPKCQAPTNQHGPGTTASAGHSPRHDDGAGKGSREPC